VRGLPCSRIFSRWAKGLVSSDRLGSWRREWAEQCIAIAISAARSDERLRELLALCDSLLDAGKPDFSSIYFAERVALVKIDLLRRLKAEAEREADRLDEEELLERMVELTLYTEENLK
jgi:hypothetical protein